MNHKLAHLLRLASRAEALACAARTEAAALAERAVAPQQAGADGYIEALRAARAGLHEAVLRSCKDLEADDAS